MSRPAGNYVALDLGPLFAADGAHVPLNLGVEWSEVPPDPPEPVIRGFRTDAGMPWGNAAALQRALATGWRQAPDRRRATRIGWQRSAALQRALTLAWGTPARFVQTTRLPWHGHMPSVQRAAVLPWASLPTVSRAASMAWSQQGLVRQGREMGWRNPGLARVSREMPWLAQTPLRRRGTLFPWLNLALAARSWKLPWGQAPQIPWVVLPPKPPTPPDDEDSPFPPGNRIGLNLGCALIDIPGLAPLNLGVTACYAVRPHRRTYIVTNSVTVVRIPDRTPIDVDSLSISGGRDAWGYSFDLNMINPEQLALLKPTVDGPRQIEITLNGYRWTAIVESYSRNREFNAMGIRLTGRSRTALLAEPYAPRRARISTVERLAAQLVDDELADTGYTATYDTVDWLVPAGAWYYDGSTPLDAIGKVAEASGAVVQSHPEDLALVVRPSYPASPWDWTTTTPDAIVLDDIVTSEQLQVRSAPLYDAVVVTGEITGKGVTATVKRTGEAGTLFAAQASSPLINTSGVAGERGRNILSDRGEQAGIDLTLPLFPMPLGAGQTGRVLPLDLVEVQSTEGTWAGLCTAIRIDVRMDGKTTVIEQTLTLERHYSDAN